MRSLFLIFTLLFSFNLLFAQNPYKKWVMNPEGITTEIEILEDDKAILYLLPDAERTEADTSAFRIMLINKTIQNENSIRIIFTRENHEIDIGLMECFNIQEDEMYMFFLAEDESIKSVKDAEEFEIPENIGLKCYSWNQVKKIKNNGKDILEASDTEIDKFLENLRTKVEDLFQHPDFERLKKIRQGRYYMATLYFETWEEMGYNIFMNETQMRNTIEKLSKNEAHEEYMIELREIISSIW